MWFFSARLTDFSSDSWLVRFGLQDEDSATQYLAAIYWTITTATTVGYGDITPLTQAELVVAMLWMVVGVGCYSFTVGSLSSFLTSIDTRDSAIAMKMAAVQEFAIQTGISHEVKAKIRDAVKYNTYKMGSIWSDKHSLFSELPKLLRYEVVWSMYNGVAKEFPIFSFFEASFLAAVMPLFRPVRQQDSIYLYREDDYPDEVFFITHGRVNFVIVPSEIVYKSFLKGSYLGEVEIFKKVNRVNNAICYGECEFLTLLKYDFLRIMEEFPAEAKELKRIATEKANRNKQAYVETLELLKLRAAKGSITDLAGKGRVVQAEKEEDLDKSALDHLHEWAASVQSDLQEDCQAFQALSAQVSSAQLLAHEALRKTGSGFAAARRKGL